MKPIKAVRQVTNSSQIRTLIDSLTQEQYDALGELVQVNVDREDYPSDIEAATRNAAENHNLYPIQNGDEIWLFTAENEAEIVALLERIKS